MLNRMILTLFVSLASSTTANAEDQSNAKAYSTYKQYFLRKVYAFGNRNRFVVNNVNRDKYINCYLIVGVETTVQANGTVKNISIKKHSLVRKADRYINYIIKNAGPFEHLGKYYGSKIETIVLFNNFRLDLNLYEKYKVTNPCRKTDSEHLKQLIL